MPPVAILTPPPTTADTMMRLQAMIAARLQNPLWFKVAAIREVDSENEYGPFKVFARLPGGNEFVAQYKPDVDDEALASTVSLLMAMHEDAMASAPQPIYDADGNQIGMEAQGVSTIETAMGAVPVKKRRAPPEKTEAQQMNEWRDYVDHVEKKEFDASVPGYPKGMDLIIHGLAYKVYDGPNTLPLPYYEMYVEWRSAGRKRDRNVGMVINASAMAGARTSGINSDHPAYVRTTLNLDEA